MAVSGTTSSWKTLLFLTNLPSVHPFQASALYTFPLGFIPCPWPAKSSECIFYSMDSVSAPPKPIQNPKPSPPLQVMNVPEKGGRKNPRGEFVAVRLNSQSIVLS
jgi:hypothetical protein